ncbi:F0F1 ATP synthase subunit delta [Homoserinimonas hongtaonis]|uniref:ATP synthase subunit delta n=1 Tax=Homoserinimonas hongtaonis TaxID=2079791 RepID=A0A2U1SXA0_9MICO|nr:F0F1 ATP synthase subunit delta [Salinibacterium hongtaonis]AWB88825.1 F0F1 ATP synthase subunit delta [Salinibacterium hongtaonis]PWB96226.1 F0F1 ATP synthase subunit delta [Salinibacterium hongtaonis]
MGSATREATATSRAALAGVTKVTLGLAEDLFSAGRVIGSSLQLRTLVADASGSPDEKVAALKAVFRSSLSADAMALLGTVVSARWSSVDDLLAGIEDLGLRAVASAAPSTVDIEGELFSFADVVAANPELELAIGSKLGKPEAKAELVDSLLTGRVSAETLAVVRHLVQQPRGRRIGQLITESTSTIADQKGSAIATVTTAAPLGARQRTKLQKALTVRYGRAVTLNLVVDPALVGGVRVAIGNDIIDGSVASRIADLRLQLAG